MKRNKKLLISLLVLPLLFSGNNTNYLKNHIKSPLFASGDDSYTPKMVVTTFNGNSKNEIGITWHLDLPSLNQTAELVEASINDFSSSEVVKLSIGKGVSLEPNLGADDAGKVYKAKFTNLKPNTKYLYRVGNSENYSDIHSFITSGDNEAFSFAHISDPQGWSYSDYDPGFLQTLKNASTKNPSLIALTGDIVDRAKEGKLNNAYNQWLWALDSTKEYLKDTIIAPVSGNHETGKYQFSSRFNLKNVDTDDGISGNYYSFLYNEAYFLCLNTNDTLNPTDPDTCTGLSDNQLNFIKSDLEKNKNAKWKFVLLHKGLFDPGEHSSNKQYEEGTYHDYDIDKIRKQLVPLFDQYNVDVVLQGHDHLYSRTLPTIAKNNGYSVGEYAEEIVNHNGKEYKTKYVTNGTIYCNTSTASGSKYYNVTTYDENMMHFEIAKGMTPRMYTNYEVDGDYLFVDSYEIDAFGEEKVYESWALTKNEIKNDQPIDEGNEEENNDKSSNTGLIVGLTISGVVIIGIAVALAIIFIKKKKGK